MDDAGLLERARRGDEAAFSRLFADYQGPIFRYGARMCGATAGEDIVQETFLTVLRGAGLFDPARETVVGYLFGIARHLVLRRLGSRYEAGPSIDVNGGLSDAAVSPEASPLEMLTQAEAIEAVRTAIQTLPPAYREVVRAAERTRWPLQPVRRR